LRAVTRALCVPNGIGEDNSGEDYSEFLICVKGRRYDEEDLSASSDVAKKSGFGENDA
jgi:hypothetical protein